MTSRCALQILARATGPRIILSLCTEPICFIHVRSYADQKHKSAERSHDLRHVGVHGTHSTYSTTVHIIRVLYQTTLIIRYSTLYILSCMSVCDILQHVNLLYIFRTYTPYYKKINTQHYTRTGRTIYASMSRAPFSWLPMQGRPCPPLSPRVPSAYYTYCMDVHVTCSQVVAGVCDAKKKILVCICAVLF